MACKLFLLLFLVATALADGVVKFESCDLTEEQADQCTVANVQITSCTEKKCKLRRGNNVTVSFDFTPKFTAQKLKNSVFWASPVMGDIPWADLDTEGCKFTACPTEAEKTQNFSYSLHIGSKVPEGKYVVKWLVLDEADANKACCFKTSIEIKKK